MANKTVLPKWARLAIFAQRPRAPVFSTMRDSEAVERHKNLWRLIIGRWLELEQGFVPALSGLSDLGKRVIFDSALGAVRDAECLPAMRQAHNELNQVNETIVDRACELAELLRRAADLREGHSLHDPMPDLWDALESAGDKFRDWGAVCADEWVPFLRIAREQSRPGPELEDVLDALVEQGCAACHDPGVTVSYPFNVAIETKATGANKDRADSLRLLIECVAPATINRRAVPMTFHLTNENLACLAEVLFDWTAGSVDSETLRKKTRPSMLDKSIDNPNSPSQYGIVRSRAPD